MGTPTPREFKPLGDYVIVQMEVPEAVTSGGIVLPSQAQKVPDPMGTVLAVGPEVKRVNAGQLVLFEGYMAKDVPHEGEADVIAVRERHIVAAS